MHQKDQSGIKEFKVVICGSGSEKRACFVAVVVVVVVVVVGAVVVVVVVAGAVATRFLQTHARSKLADYKSCIIRIWSLFGLGRRSTLVAISSLNALF